MKALLFFDLLGISALNALDVGKAAQTLNQFSLVLESATKKHGWEFGFHLSDSSFLVSNDINKAILEAAQLWKSFFLHDVYQLGEIAVHPMDALVENKRFEALECLPRGCIAWGDLNVIPGLRWIEGKGFERLERRVFIRTDRIKTSSITYKLENISEITYNELPDQDITEIIIPRLNSNESILGFMAVDSSQESTFVHIGEIGNITGIAVVKAVKASEHSGLKGPRLLVDCDGIEQNISNPLLSAIPDSELYDILWNADFSNPQNSSIYFTQGLNIFRKFRNSSHSIVRHYSALFSVITKGIVASYIEANKEAELEQKLRSIIDATPKLIHIWDDFDKTRTPHEIIYSLIAPAVIYLYERFKIQPKEVLGKPYSYDIENWAKLFNDSLCPHVE